VVLAALAGDISGATVPVVLVPVEAAAGSGAAVIKCCLLASPLMRRLRKGSVSHWAAVVT
jgi:hypothetical protein